MNTDRELLELAAKAAGIDLQTKPMFGGDSEPGFYDYSLGKPLWHWWNPLIDGGNALRLAVKLNIRLEPNCNEYAYARAPECHGLSPTYFSEQHNGDPHAATRRAIVRAAAAMGKEMA